MKYYIAIFLTVMLTWLNSCKPTESLQLQLDSISKDSLYISQNLSWQTADANQISDTYGKGAKVCTVDVVKIDKNILLLVTASAVKTSDDSIYLFVPPDYGGRIVVGRLASGQIQSDAKSFNGKKIEWTTTHSFKINNVPYDRLYKVDMDWFKEVLIKYSYERGKDSLGITLAGP